MTQSSKVCLNFETGEEVKDVMISLDNNAIFFKDRTSFYSPINGDITVTQEITKEIQKSIPSDPIFQKYPLLLEFQKKVGFDVYGKYVMLENNFRKRFEIGNIYYLTGDVVKYKHNDEYRFYVNTFEHTEFNGFGRFKAEEISDIYYTESSTVYCNIIQELSKHYRGEENKFKEARRALGV